MSKSLLFVDHVFQTGRKLEKLGMLTEASEAYQRLLGVKLPGDLAHEVPGALGKLQLERGQFAKARRNLSLALARQPGNAEYHRLLARAIEADEGCNPDRAGKFYRRSVRLEPNNPHRLVDLAFHLIQRGEDVKALKLLRQAFFIGSDDLEIVRAVAEGLRELGELKEANRLLGIAQFNHGRDPNFLRICSEHRFHQVRIRQKDVRTASFEESPILRFVPKPIAV